MACDESVMRAVLDQMIKADFTLDYEVMAASLGADVSKSAAKQRWYKLKKTLIGASGMFGFLLSQGSVSSCLILLPSSQIQHKSLSSLSHISNLSRFSHRDSGQS